MKNILIMGNLWMLKVFKQFTARDLRADDKLKVSSDS